MGEIYSHSRLETFERCPRRFFYRYRLQLPAESESVEAFVGKQVHEVLERLYRVAQEGKVPRLPQVLARFRQLFDDTYDAERIRIVRVEEPLSAYRELGEHCLSNYYHDHYPFDADETLGIEERVVFDVGETAAGPVQLQGFVDRVARARDGALEIHDYKTGARVPSQRAIDEDRQLALYQLGIAKRFAESQPFRLVWHFVRKGIIRTSTRTREQLETVRRETLSRVERIERERDWAPKVTPLCRWCEYRDGCSASPVRRTDVPSYDDRPRVQAAAMAATAPPRTAGPQPAADQLALPLGPAPALG